MSEIWNETLEEVLIEEEILTESEVGSTSELVVYNDDVNTFDWVIQCFVEILRHTYEQAEQLSLIVHYKGKATVKTAARTILVPMKDALLDRGLSAVIEDMSK